MKKDIAMTKLAPLAPALALLLAACAGGGGTKTAGPAPDAPKAAAATGDVEARATQRWALLVGAKYAEAYDYLSPGYRATTPREQYATSLTGRPVKWLGATVTGKDCPAGEAYCDVGVNVEYEVQSTLPGVGAIKSVGPVQERWIEIDGSWYFVPKEVTRNDRGLR